MKRLLSREEAFTGLEAAIVLIAFVVVAAVFSYVVLGAGFFSTQKAQESVHTGVQQASSSFEILGDVYGLVLPPATNQINWLNLTMGVVPGGMAIDMTKVTMVWSNASWRRELNLASSTAFVENPPGDTWSIYQDINGNKNFQLEAGEQMDIRVHLQDASAISPRDVFSLEIRPIVGSSLTITRTAPGGLDMVNRLY
ncbi:MAG TPA: archaellin/type IV pilin N-terminal domain-containing protein [Methanomicrobiales archaeon]|nr:archaellin/type IV pilin N-terminal domain-containing protein [Methanomicrobiales archaeon]